VISAGSTESLGRIAWNEETRIGLSPELVKVNSHSARLKAYFSPKLQSAVAS